MDKKTDKPCIQVELADYCFDQEVMPDPEYESSVFGMADDSSVMSAILDAPDDADLLEIKNMVLVEELLCQKVVDKD